MAGVGSISSRTTSLQINDSLLRSLQRTQQQLFRAQNEINTLKSVNKPSEGPDKTSSILFLEQNIQERVQINENLQFALSMLNNADAALGDVTDVLIEAQSLASGQVGVGSDDETRKATAEVVDAQLTAIIEIANRQFNDLSIFGGNNGAGRNGEVFVEFLGGIRYLGSDTSLTGDIGDGRTQTINSNGLAAFGALSSRVRSQVDLDPTLVPTTKLSDVNGAQQLGVRSGSVQLVVDGAATVVDLTSAETVDDVVTRINAAINVIDPTAGAVTLNDHHFDLTANAGHTITIADIGESQTAADLGITGTAASVTLAGGDLNARITQQTSLGSLDAMIDFVNGLMITQGTETRTVAVNATDTVQDLQNRIESLGIGVRLEINDAGDSFNLISEVSGLSMSIGENGGTTAADLGLLTLGSDTRLDSFRNGLGVEPQEGVDDFRISLHDGTTIDIDATGLTTVGDLMARIQAEADAVTAMPGDLTVSLATVGTGIVLTDNTAGGGEFKVENLGLSLVADQLGLTANAGAGAAGASLTSEDKAQVRVDSVFTHLKDLSEALRNNDTLGITLAGERVENDVESVTSARATVGIEAARVVQTQQRMDDIDIMEKSMLSQLQDADLTEVITRYAQLQQQLEASLQSGSLLNQLSLLDFLR